MSGKQIIKYILINKYCLKVFKTFNFVENNKSEKKTTFEVKISYYNKSFYDVNFILYIDIKFSYYFLSYKKKNNFVSWLVLLK